MDVLIFFLVLAYTIICCCMAGAIYDKPLGYFAGLLFGVFGVIIASILSLNAQYQREKIKEQVSQIQRTVKNQKQDNDLMERYQQSLREQRIKEEEEARQIQQKKEYVQQLQRDKQRRDAQKKEAALEEQKAAWEQIKENQRRELEDFEQGQHNLTTPL